MKSITILLKENLTNIPFTIGNILAAVPYNYRPGLGKIYSERKKEIKRLSEKNTKEKEAFVLKRMRYLTEYAYKNVPFYKKHYDEQNFKPSQLKTFADIQEIPVINKNLLQQSDIEERSVALPNRYPVNTGGSSGKPLSIYITPDSMAHEWAHMHKIWSKIGFKQSDLKMILGGRSGNDDFLSYDAVRHSYNFNIYRDLDKNKQNLINLANSRKIKYLHGYPSAIYELALFCKQENNLDLREALKTNLCGVFLSSEYPTQTWRNCIEETFDIDSVSWYGHTERAILAYEKNEQFTYHPFLSYGYTEVLNVADKQHLIGTSYYNFTTPLIRYDTEDFVTSLKYEGNILSSFKIADGRVGEFILDKNNKKIPLTGLIFGRHHKLFDMSKHIQVSQDKAGKAVILYTLIDIEQKINAKEYFDSSDIEIEFHFRALKQPIKTISGKVRLLVKI